MLLTITSRHHPVTDLGFLLHQHPDRFLTVDLSIGQAHVFYSKRSVEETTVALLLDMDPIDMVRGSVNKQAVARREFTMGVEALVGYLR